MCLNVYFLCKVALQHKPPTSSGAWWWRRLLSVPAQEPGVDDDSETGHQAPGRSLPEGLSRVVLTHLVSSASAIEPKFWVRSDGYFCQQRALGVTWSEEGPHALFGRPSGSLLYQEEGRNRCRSPLSEVET